MTSDVPTENRGGQPDEPVHDHLDRDPGRDQGADLEDSAAYERAVEEDAPLPAGDRDPGAGELAPKFTEPQERR